MQNVQEIPMKPIVRIKKIKELVHRGCRTSHQLQIKHGMTLCDKYMLRTPGGDPLPGYSHPGASDIAPLASEEQTLAEEDGMGHYTLDAVMLQISGAL